MKNRIVYALILTALFFTKSYSQKSIIKFQIGYGIPLTNTLISQNVQGNSSGTTYTGVYGSYGSGLRLEGGYIRPLNTHLSLELDFAYLIGKSINSTYNTPNNSQQQTNSAHLYEFSPLLRVNLGGNKVKPYASIGPIIGLGNLVADYNANGIDIQRKYSGSASLGAKTAVGAEFTEGRFIFYTQITLIAMSYAPSKSEYTKYTQNGVDQLSMMPVSQKQTVYKSSFTPAANPDPNQPTEQLKFYTPFSNISLNVGVMFKL